MTNSKQLLQILTVRAGFLTAVVSMLLAGYAKSIADSSCPTTPKLEVVSAIAPAAGSYPVWVVDGPNGHWRGSEALVKTAWILARDNPGDLTVVATRLDGNGRALFKSTVTADLSDRLVIANADTQQMIPGGIEPDALGKYSFRSSAILYPSAGCWELLVHYGKSESRIVVELTDQP